MAEKTAAKKSKWDSLSGLLGSFDTSKPATGRDVLTVQRGKQENRGLGNILQNLDLVGASERVANKEMQESDEDRALKQDYMRSQSENLRALGGYRQGMLDARKEANDISRIKADISRAKSEAEISQFAQELEVKKQNAKAAMMNAETNQKNAITREQFDQADMELKQAKFTYQQAQDTIDNELKNQALMVQKGYLGIAGQKVAPEIANINARTVESGARTGQIGAETAKTEAEVERMGSPEVQTGLISDALTKGQKAGIITPSGAGKVFSVWGGPEKTGVNAPEPSIWDKLGEKIGLTKEQTVVTPPKITKKTTKSLDAKTAAEYLKKAGGNKDLARKMAKIDGYIF